jgi:hypothetical protein
VKRLEIWIRYSSPIVRLAGSIEPRDTLVQERAPARVVGAIRVTPSPPAERSLSRTEYSAELPATASSWSTLARRSIAKPIEPGSAPPAPV